MAPTFPFILIVVIGWPYFSEIKFFDGFSNLYFGLGYVTGSASCKINFCFGLFSFSWVWGIIFLVFNSLLIFKAGSVWCLLKLNLFSSH